ncbi:MAG: type II toxin-antitoxin system Phd/YefM family antitoxin [Rhodanobacteraceae bacterium]
MRRVGAFAAKNTLGTLLDLVEAGEDVVITRRGKPVARMTNAQSQDQASNRAADAAARIRARAARVAGPVTWAEWKSLRDDGRR